MAYQNLFEQLQDTCNFVALEDDMAQIINALEKDLIEQSSDFNEAKKLLKKLTDDVGDYCKYCGDVDPRCQCWNDE